MNDRSKAITEKPINIILVGDTGVGKSALISSYAKNEFPLYYEPTIFDQYQVGDIFHHQRYGEKQTYNLTLMDTSGLPDHKPIRQSMYKTADVIVFCFSLAGLKIPKKRGEADENGGDGI